MGKYGPRQRLCQVLWEIRTNWIYKDKLYIQLYIISNKERLLTQLWESRSPTTNSLSESQRTRKASAGIKTGEKARCRQRCWRRS